MIPIIYFSYNESKWKQALQIQVLFYIQIQCIKMCLTSFDNIDWS